MKTIFCMSIKKAFSDPYLLFWSIFIPMANIIFTLSILGKKNYAVYILTSMVALSVLSYAFMNVSFRVFYSKERALFNLLKVTPMPLYKYLLSMALAWMLISTAGAFIVLIVSSLIYKVTFSIISIVGIFFAILVASFFYIFLGFIVSILNKEVSRLNILNNLFFMSSLFLSTAFYSENNIPVFMKIILKVNPFEYFINAIRSSVVLSVNSYFINISVLIGLSLIMLLTSSIVFRYRLKIL